MKLENSSTEHQHGGYCIYALDTVDCERIQEIEELRLEGIIKCA